MPNLRPVSLAIIVLALSVTACAGASTPPAGGKVAPTNSMQSQRPLATTAVPSRIAEPSATSLPEATTIPASLNETEWVLTALRGDGTVEGVTVVLRFHNHNELFGETGCTNYSATFRTTGDNFIITDRPIQQTSNHCANGEEARRQDEAYYMALLDVTRYRLAGKRLELHDETNNPVLAFDLKELPPVDRALVGKVWLLKSLNGTAMVEGTRITLQFGGERLGGYSGCNAYGAELEAADDGVLKMGEMGGTAKGCGAGAIRQQEDSYWSTLKSAARYRVSDDKLEILDRAGDVVLEFARKRELAMNPAKLIDTRWLLLSMDGRKPAGDAKITLHLKGGGRIGGKVACAVYTGRYAAKGDDIWVSPESMDRARCSGRVPGGQEDLYTTYLENSSDYRLNGKRLEIITVDGDKLVFRRLR